MAPPVILAAGTALAGLGYCLAGLSRQLRDAAGRAR